MPKIHSHNNFFVFTGALVALLVCSGLITSTPAGDYHMALQLAMIGTEIVAYFSLSLTRRWRRFVIIILAITLAANVFKESSSWSFAPVTVLLAYLVFLVGMTIAATRQAMSM